jgi:hypothetical protein
MIEHARYFSASVEDTFNQVGHLIRGERISGTKKDTMQ